MFSFFRTTTVKLELKTINMKAMDLTGDHAVFPTVLGRHDSDLRRQVLSVPRQSGYVQTCSRYFLTVVASSMGSFVLFIKGA